MYPYIIIWNTRLRYIERYGVEGGGGSERIRSRSSSRRNYFYLTHLLPLFCSVNNSAKSPYKTREKADHSKLEKLFETRLGIENQTARVRTSYERSLQSNNVRWLAERTPQTLLCIDYLKFLSWRTLSLSPRQGRPAFPPPIAPWQELDPWSPNAYLEIYFCSS